MSLAVRLLKSVCFCLALYSWLPLKFNLQLSHLSPSLSHSSYSYSSSSSSSASSTPYPVADAASASRQHPSLPPGLTGMDFSPAFLLSLRARVHNMFSHAYGAYMQFAFPHDELKPLSKSWTDSLSELGNSRKSYPEYKGVALTLIDSLSTLAVLGEKEEFATQVDWVGKHVNFDVDVRVNLFEANIRLLGGLLSAHVLALDPHLNLHPHYDGRLLVLAKDLGDRFLPAFTNVSPFMEREAANASAAAANKRNRNRNKPQVQLPYAWINLRHGVEAGETAEQCAAGIGTLLLEFGLLSHLTNDTLYYDVAERSLFELWRRRNTNTNLIGNSLSCITGEWSNSNAGIGAGIDSFFEYLLKSSIFFDNIKFLHMFEISYQAVQKYLKFDKDWYVESEMHTGTHTHVQFNSLGAFFPGLQVMSGDISRAAATHAKHFGLWQQFDGLPERYLLQQRTIHSTEKHYILRPELMESTYFLYRSTRNPIYLEMGLRMLESLEKYAKVDGGYASFRDVESKELEDRMNSFFLAETVKYLYLLFDEENWVHSTRTPRDASEQQQHSSSPLTTASNWIFTTEGHLFPLLSSIHVKFGDLSALSGQYSAQIMEAATRNSNAHVFSTKEIASLAKTMVYQPASQSKSKYSLFSSPRDMNADTRTYYQHWKEEKGVDFKRLAKEAVCKKIKRRYRNSGKQTKKAKKADAGHSKKQRHRAYDGENELEMEAREATTEFLQLAHLFHKRHVVSHQCYLKGPMFKSRSSSSSPASSSARSSGAKPVSPATVTTPTVFFPANDFKVSTSEGGFLIQHVSTGELLDVRNLGTNIVQITNQLTWKRDHRGAPVKAVDANKELLNNIAANSHAIPPTLHRTITFDSTGSSYASKILLGPLIPSAYVLDHSSGRSGGEREDQQFDLARNLTEIYQRVCSCESGREWEGVGSFFGPHPSSNDIPSSSASSSPSSSAPLPLRPLKLSSYNTTDFLTSTLLLANPEDGCTDPPLIDAQLYADRIILLSRGQCTFQQKIFNMQKLGARGVIMHNQHADNPDAADSSSSSPASLSTLLMMGSDGSSTPITIPSLMVSHSTSELLRHCTMLYQQLQGRLIDIELVRYEVRKEKEETKPVSPSASPSFSPSSSPSFSPFPSARPPSPTERSLSSLTPLVLEGASLAHFRIMAMGGWTVEIEKKQNNFQLKVY